VSVCGSQRRFVTGSARNTFVRVWDLDSGAEIGK
jgi:serine-threonine kinase receptor-associated protein